MSAGVGGQEEKGLAGTMPWLLQPPRSNRYKLQVAGGSGPSLDGPGHWAGQHYFPCTIHRRQSIITHVLEDTAADVWSGRHFTAELGLVEERILVWTLELASLRVLIIFWTIQFRDIFVNFKV